MRKLIVKLAMLLLPVFSIIAGVNYYADPAILFHPGYEAMMAQIMLSGENVKCSSNFNDRALQIELIQRKKDVSGTAVIGGSKAMMISNKALEGIFGDTRCFNYCMSQATLYDFIGVIDRFREKGQFPTNILFSMDPHILSPLQQNEMYQSFQDYQAEEKWFLNKQLPELFSFSYFRNSLKVFDIHKSSVSPVATRAVSDPTDPIKLPDGRRVYPQKVLSVTVEQSNTMALNTAREIVKNSGSNRDMDPVKVKKFEEMIGELQARGVNLAFFLPPYHPVVYKTIQGADMGEIAAETETYLLDFARARGIRVYGSYNPGFTGRTDADYFDNGHLRSEKVDAALKLR